MLFLARSFRAAILGALTNLMGYSIYSDKFSYKNFLISMMIIFVFELSDEIARMKQKKFDGD